MSRYANRHGLPRYIEAATRREVRRRCKFGCVVCRAGLYQYEHIDPPFADAREHDPDRICCLCASCHDRVTRGHLSKQAVAEAYARIAKADSGDTQPPTGPLDFSGGTANLRIGGLTFLPLVRTVLRYHGRDYIRLKPGAAEGDPGEISALFTDDSGRRTLELDSNEWIGSTDGWDIEVEGNRLTVRTAPRQIALSLRLEPPTRLVLERLDMRIGDGHVLVGEEAYAVGRYVEEDRICWAYAKVHFYNPPPEAVAIEFTTPAALERRDQHFRGIGSEMATEGRWCVLNSRAGCLFKPLGIAIATMINGFGFMEAAIGTRGLDDVRGAVFHDPEELVRVIGSGEQGLVADG